LRPTETAGGIESDAEEDDEDVAGTDEAKTEVEAETEAETKANDEEADDEDEEDKEGEADTDAALASRKGKEGAIISGVICEGSNGQRPVLRKPAWTLEGL
jgi:hypothetical protein